MDRVPDERHETETSIGGDAPLDVAHPGRLAAQHLLWPHFVVLLVGIVWGATFSLAKIATEGGAHPLGLSLWQGLLGGLLLMALAVVRRRPPRLSRRHLGFYLVCALLGTVLPGTLLFYAAPHLPAGVLSITVATVPMLTYAIIGGLSLERLSGRRLTGLFLGLGAILLLVGPESSLPSRDMVPWVLIAVLSAASYAAENVFIAERRPPGCDSLAIVAAMLVTASIVLLPLVLATGTFVSLAGPWGRVEWSILAMVAANAFSYALFFHLVGIAGAVFASQSAYTVTLSGVLWGMAIFGELHSAWVWAALLLMMGGLALVTPRKT